MDSQKVPVGNLIDLSPEKVCFLFFFQKICNVNIIKLLSETIGLLV